MLSDMILLAFGRYGYPFLYETYLYHLIRTDNRHNFSVYFYDLYLRYSALHARPSYWYVGDRYNTSAGVGLGLLAFVPQMLTIIVISIRFGRDLCFSLFLLTYVFVIFNKVCTAQVILTLTKTTYFDADTNSCSISCGIRRFSRSFSHIRNYHFYGKDRGSYSFGWAQR